MVLFEGMPYQIPMIYLKVAGNKEVVSMPLWEAITVLKDISYDYNASIAESKIGKTHYVFKGENATGKAVECITKEELIKHLQANIYNDKFKIVDMAIQPEDEHLIDAVNKLIGV